MIRKYFFTSALLSLALVLVATEVAQAQSRLRERRSERRSMRRGNVVLTEVVTPATTATTMRTSYYYTPEIIRGDRTGHIQLKLPHAQAKVTFDDVATTQTGTERTYHTPVLTMGTTNMYRIRATWMHDEREVIQEQLVPVLPGRTVVVTFPRP